MTVKTLQHGVSVLRGGDIAGFSNGNYKLICHSDVAYQLGTSSGTKGWIQYTEAKIPGDAAGLVAKVAGVDIYQSTLGYKFALSGDTMETSSGNLYASLLFGDEAYGAITISDGNKKGFSFFIKEDKSNSNTSDPCSLMKTAGYTIRSCGKILNSSSGLWIVTAG
jgi:N4-gp56 family major capsid protein